jgi:hypothetical protein
VATVCIDLLPAESAGRPSYRRHHGEDVVSWL